MSRIVTFVVVIALLFTIHVGQYVAVATLEPLQDDLINDGGPAEYDKQKIGNQIFEVLTKWMVLILDAGVIAWAFGREYMRQRTAAPRGI